MKPGKVNSQVCFFCFHRFVRFLRFETCSRFTRSRPLLSLTFLLVRLISINFFLLLSHWPSSSRIFLHHPTCFIVYKNGLFGFTHSLALFLVLETIATGRWPPSTAARCRVWAPQPLHKIVFWWSSSDTSRSTCSIPSWTVAAYHRTLCVVPRVINKALIIYHFLPSLFLITGMVGVGRQPDPKQHNPTHFIKVEYFFFLVAEEGGELVRLGLHVWFVKRYTTESCSVLRGAIYHPELSITPRRRIEERASGVHYENYITE